MNRYLIWFDLNIQYLPTDEVLLVDQPNGFTHRSDVSQMRYSPKRSSNG